MQRIFYFSGFRMTVFDWDEKTLIDSREFMPDSQGLKDFEYLLKNSLKIPGKLLVDMIEEDFRRETMPHVGLTDRKGLLDRLIDKHYRDETYVHAKILGRSKLGRKDDRVLLSALTNTSLLAPWLERLEKHGERLAGIWSIPLLTDKLLKPIVNEDKHALIVSRQVRSALRNSYFQDGKLLLSRQAKFDQDMWDKEDFEGVIANLERGTIEIYNFLQNQRIMEGDDHLNVYCILNEEQLSDARALASNTEQIHYAFLSLEQLFNHFGIQNHAGRGADALFAYLCTRTNPLYDHYATDDQKSTYYQYLVDKFVTQVTEIGSLVFITAAVVFALNSLKLGQQTEQLNTQINLLRAEYNEKYAAMSSELETAEQIKTSVELVERLERSAQQAPHRYFSDLGGILNRPQFANLRLTQIDWQKRPSPEVTQLLINHELSLSEENDPYLRENLMQEYFDELDQEGTPGLKATMTLVGRVITEGRSYRSTIGAMDLFVAELENLPGVEDVLLLTTAVDVRDTSRFTGRVGETESSDSAESDKFEILIVWELPQSA
ncbi:MAG: hypothetical protein ACE37D_15020 [Pseudomonadales bacterium]